VVQTWNFEDYTHFTVVVFGGIVALIIFIALLSTLYDRSKTRFLPSGSIRSLQLEDTDSKYALEMIGDDSVYQFFLGKSFGGWTIALACLASQLWMTFLFVEASEVDLTDDRSDLSYTWKCPR
jgi:hypothetical protein